MKFMVTGATGHLGAKVMERLLETQSPKHLIALVRDAKKAAALSRRGIEIRKGDYDFPHSLESAFHGADKLLLISSMGDNETRMRHHAHAIDAAKRAKVKHIVYTSLAKADASSLGLAEVHRAAEAAIRETGIPFTILRNNWYIENEQDLIQNVAAGSPLYTSAGGGRVGWAPRADFALAAANALLAKGHAHKVFELSGPPATYADLVAILSKLLGREVPLENVDDGTFTGILAKAGLPAPMIEFVVDVHRSIREGALDIQGGDFEMLLGRPVTPLEQAVANMLKESQVPA